LITFSRGAVAVRPYILIFVPCILFAIEKREEDMGLKYARQLSSNRRLEILQAVETIGDRYEAGETYTSINMPPRYGKSAVIRLAALELQTLTGMPVIMTAPWIDNVDQIKEKAKIIATFKAYGIAESVPFSAHRVSALATHEWWKQSTGAPTFLTCTMGLINNKANQQQFIDGLNDLRQRTGYRPIVLIDECHLIKELQVWGDFVRRMVEEVDAFIVLLTGTAVPGIPGFECSYGDWKDFIKKIPRRKVVDGEIKFVRDVHEGERRSVSDIKGNINVTWEHAWDIHALAQVNAAWINIEVIDRATNESLGQLSDLKQEELNGRIKEIMEAPEMMRGLAKTGIRRLLAKRRHASTAQAIVFTGADEFNPGDEQGRDRSVDKHAKEFKRLLQREAANCSASLRIVIATGNVENASEVVKAFRRGEIDVLIVKMMGAVGLDVEACKLLIWGSRMRNGPLAIQALSRVLTTWGNEHADMVLPEDCRMVQLYNRVVKDQGGEYSESKSQLVGTEDYEPEVRPEWQFNGVRIDAYSDERGSTLNGEFEDILHLIKQKYQTQGIGDIQIIENFRRGGFPISEEEEKKHRQEKEENMASPIVDLDEELANVEGEFGPESNKITSRYIDYKLSPEIWRKKDRELKSVAKEICGVPKGVPVPKIDDAALLKRLIAALEVASKRVFAGYAPL
jgi:hypothetical protein